MLFIEGVNETTVHVWDVRRPYLPYVTYDEHRDSVTDACWPTNDFDVFLTCGKDGLVVLHNIDSGHVSTYSTIKDYFYFCEHR